MNRATVKEHAPSLTVTALSAAFGVALIQGTSIMATMITEHDAGSFASVQLALAMVATVFIIIAVYVGSIVTANTFATIIAGRTRTIALMRLLGSTSVAQRRAVVREGLVVGVAGSLFGGVVGVALTAGGIRIAELFGQVDDLDYVVVDPLVLLPILMVVVSTWAASRVGSRRVLVVTPMQATAAAHERPHETIARRPWRTAIAVLLLVGGLAVLAAGVAVGLVSPWGFIIAFLGGLGSFTGVIVGAPVFMPALLRATGRLLGRSAPAQLAAQNSVRYPERSARTTVGLVIGVTLITTFAVAAQGFIDMLSAQPDMVQDIDDILMPIVGVFSALIGFSAVIAGFGVINNLTLGVLQRSREFGLLRALGFTASQVRRMIVAESVQLTVAGVGFGVVLGILYGWAGAQSLLGPVLRAPGLVAPSVPWLLIAGLAAGVALITLVGSQLPARRATRVSPMAALAVD